MEKNIELLSPASTFEGIRSAVNCGCDAVYFGGKAFNARQYASNFSDEEIKRAIDYCHLRGIKVRITLNILYKDEEINDVLEFVAKLYEYGADALIIQDLGIFSLIKKNFPEIRLHASTQMTIHNSMGCEYMKEIGFNRVVASRELSLDEIRAFCETGVETEAFVHGAVCVCYSGRCLMSSFIGGRSGNRGRCAQPCRMEYSLIEKADGISKTVKKGYLISPKDMFTADIAQSLVDVGISAFKIEGRMKSPEYIALATKTYRKAIDEKTVTEDDKNRLLQIFNRGGGSYGGYYGNWAGTDMISRSPKHSGLKIGEVIGFNARDKRCKIKLEKDVNCGDGIEIWTKAPHTGTNISEVGKKGEIITVVVDGKPEKGDEVYKSYDKKLNDELKRLYLKDERQRKIKLSLNIETDKQAVCGFDFNGKHYEFLSDFKAQKPENSPMTEEKIISALSKTGGTPFIFEFEIKHIDEVFIPVSSLNAFRRSITESIEGIIASSYERKADYKSYTPKGAEEIEKKTAVSVLCREQFDEVMKFKPDRVYVDFYDDVDYYVENKGLAEIFVSLPYIVRIPYEDFEKRLLELEKTDIDGYLARNHIRLKTDKKIIADYTFNVFNSASFEFMKKSYSGVTISPELSEKEAKRLCFKGSESIAYGRIPLMTTHQCPIGLYKGGKTSGRYCKMRFYDKSRMSYELKDRKGELFPIFTDCRSCTAQFMSPPLSSTVKAETRRFIFTDESPEKISAVMKEYTLSGKIIDAVAYYSKGVM